ncbi:hypothetical protein TrVE_jg7152 [Triparma verrucosa]|uniref:Uncharacterized protein n=1 Tax=Triparma verrucosa TaxID=1606542 RepID=A0A9W7FNE9_9STRA|nr:hypothetical protein TrVE_jg7152 [Triparma verrucosa]
MFKTPSTKTPPKCKRSSVSKRLPLSPVSSNASNRSTNRFSRSARKAKRNVKKGASVVFTSRSKSPVRISRKGSDEHSDAILEDFRFEMPLDVESELSGAIEEREHNAVVEVVEAVETVPSSVSVPATINKTNSFSAADAQRVIIKGVVQQERERLARLEAENGAVSPKPTAGNVWAPPATVTVDALFPYGVPPLPPPKLSKSPELPPVPTPPPPSPTPNPQTYSANANDNTNVHHHYTHAISTPLKVSMANDTNSLVTSLKAVSTTTMDRLRAIGSVLSPKKANRGANIASMLSPKRAKTPPRPVAVELAPPPGTPFSLDVSSLVNDASTRVPTPSRFLPPKPQLSPMRTNARSSGGTSMTPVRSASRRY